MHFQRTPIKADKWVQEVINRSCDHLGIKRLDAYKNNSCNAFAIVQNNGYRYIEYDPNLLRNLGSINAIYPVVIILHEVGHHYDWCTDGVDRRSKEDELEADEIAGYLANKLFGYDLHQCQKMFDLPMFVDGGDEHPIGFLRKRSFGIGWKRATRQTINLQPKKVCRNNDNAILYGLGGLAVLTLAVAIFGGKNK